MHREADPQAVPFELVPGERLLWTGAPRRGLTLRARDVSRLPLRLLVTAWIGCWVVVALFNTSAPWQDVFVLAVLAVVVLRVIVWPLARGAWRRARTRYALTTTRVVVAVSGAAPVVTTLDLALLPAATLAERAGGSGTITFAWRELAPPLRVRRGKYPEPPLAPLAAFEFVPDARRVYDIVCAAQRTLRSAPPDSARVPDDVPAATNSPAATGC